MFFSSSLTYSPHAADANQKLSKAVKWKMNNFSETPKAGGSEQRWANGAADLPVEGQTLRSPKNNEKCRESGAVRIWAPVKGA